MSDLSNKVITISVNYLGPAAKIFMSRQTTGHMNGLVFDNLERKHLPELAKWVQISAGLVIDKGKAKELAEKIANL